MEKYKALLLFGAPGSGKGTQGKILGNIPGFFRMACGDVFRSLDLTSDIGKLFWKCSKEGELVPDDITINIWKAHIDKMLASKKFNPQTDSLILDGIPRNIHQAELLNEYIDVQHVFHLACAQHEIIYERITKRAITEDRFDDVDLDLIKHRLEVYTKTSKPTLAFYNKEKIHRIDATQSPHQVLRDILSQIQ